MSEPGRNPHIQRAKIHRSSPTRLSPLQSRKHHDLGKTLSVGAALGERGVASAKFFCVYTILLTISKSKQS